MVEMRIEYQGQKHCESLHQPSQYRIETDAPKDNHGKGERFSPTDLLGASLCSCMLTVMGIQAEPLGVHLKGSWAKVVKVMAANPRRVSELKIELHLPSGLSVEQQEQLVQIAHTCPVRLSLHPDLQSPIDFIWDVNT